MTRPLASAVCLLVLVCAGCGKTKRDVITDYAPRMQERRAELREIAAKLPGPGAAADRNVNPDPAPVYNDRGDGNVAFLALEQVGDPEARPEFEFYLGGKLHNCLLWTGPKSPMVESALRSSAGNLARDFDDALACRYLGVLRTLNYEKPAVVDDRTFRGGNLDLEVLLVDLTSKQVLTAFRVSAQADPQVTVTVKQGENREARAEEYVRSTLWANARKQIAQGLTQRTGGVFQLEP